MNAWSLTSDSSRVKFLDSGVQRLRETIVPGTAGRASRPGAIGGLRGQRLCLGRQDRQRSGHRAVFQRQCV